MRKVNELRDERARVADHVVSVIRNALVDSVPLDAMPEFNMNVGKFDKTTSQGRWVGGLHQLVSDLFIGGRRETKDWKTEDLHWFHDAWLLMDGSLNIKNPYKFSHILYEQLGLDRDFFRNTLLRGADIGGIVVPFPRVGSSALKQAIKDNWEREIGSS